MNKRIALLLTMALGLTATCGYGAEWTNLDEEHRLAGRKASEGYLTGKIVMLERCNFADAKSLELQSRFQEIWQSFHGKPFVMLASVSGGTPETAKELAKKDGLAFGMYSDLSVGDGPIYPITVVNVLGKRLYRGSDERKATEILVTAITDYLAPKDFAQAKQFLDFEIEHLPAHAILRYADMEKKFKKDRKLTAELKKCEAQVKELKKLPKIADVMKLVSTADKAKNFAAKKAMDRKRLPGRLRDAIAKYKTLKENEDPRLAQEAKNALADLQWKLSELEN